MSIDVKIRFSNTEWAMKNNLWGHALFLASKLDKRTYANVMMRFANGLTINDPLQTLYQLLSGRTPAAVTVSQLSIFDRNCQLTVYFSVLRTRNGATGAPTWP